MFALSRLLRKQYEPQRESSLYSNCDRQTKTMKELPTVTLIAYDNSNCSEKTADVLHYCAKFFKFASIRLVCRLIPRNSDGILLVHTFDAGYQAALRWEICGLDTHFATEHSLFVSRDGFIINPDKWTDDWLAYDMIGAPWPLRVLEGRATDRVGNTGFCLRSKKFATYCRMFAERYDKANMPADVFSCQHMRPEFEDRGIRYAPVGIAADFSYELDIDEYPKGRSDAFGQHGKEFKELICTS